MQLRLTDGSVVDAKKDCECLDTIHASPHWIYMDDMWRESNQRLRAAGNIRGFIEAELVRVREKGREMSQRGVVEIVR